MKILNNPIVVGILAVLALGLVFMNVVWPMLRKAPQSAKRPAAPTPPLTTPYTSAMRATDQARDIASKFSNFTATANAGLASAAPSPSSVNIESATPRTDLMRWTGTPQRDPFQIRHLRKTASETNAYPPAMELLTLGGIWRQAGGTLAVINKRVFSEGDTILINKRLAEGDTTLKFTIKNIDADRVWVEGPNGREAVDFKVGLPDPPNAPEDAPPGAPKPNL